MKTRTLVATVLLTTCCLAAIAAASTGLIDGGASSQLNLNDSLSAGLLQMRELVDFGAEPNGSVLWVGLALMAVISLGHFARNK